MTHDNNAVYVIEDKKTGKRYVGQTTKSAQFRFIQHLSESRTKKGKRTHFLNAIRKRPSDFSVIGTLVVAPHMLEQDPDALNALETAMIARLRTAFRGYNLTAGGQGTKRPEPQAKKENRERITRLYSEGEPLGNIAKITGIGITTFKRWLKEWDVPRPEGAREKHKAQILHWHAQGKSNSQIGQKLRERRATIAGWLRHYERTR